MSPARQRTLPRAIALSAVAPWLPADSVHVRLRHSLRSLPRERVLPIDRDARLPVRARPRTHVEASGGAGRAANPRGVAPRHGSGRYPPAVRRAPQAALLGSRDEGDGEVGVGLVPLHGCEPLPVAAAPSGAVTRRRMDLRVPPFDRLRVVTLRGGVRADRRRRAPPSFAARRMALLADRDVGRVGAQAERGGAPRGMSRRSIVRGRQAPPGIEVRAGRGTTALGGRLFRMFQGSTAQASAVAGTVQGLLVTTGYRHVF